MKSTLLSLVFAVAVLEASASIPSVTDVQLTESGDWNRLFITYRLSGAPAVVTVDVLTNGVSIGGEHLRTLSGDVNRVVENGNETKTVVWNVVEEWSGKKIDGSAVSAIVTAWPTNSPPDYMVVDLRNDGSRGGIERIRYFTSTNFLPGGLLSTNYYRTDAMILRRIHAANRPAFVGRTKWTPGFETRLPRFEATLTNDYYIGVFPVTQYQWALVQQNAGRTSASELWPSFYSNVEFRNMRPVEKVSYNTVRGSKYPSAPNSNTYISRLRSQTGLAFDLPGDVQWEYACNGDTTDGFWNDGSPMTKAGSSASSFTTCANLPGRYSGNVGPDSANANCDADSGTAIVGSYPPSTWGLYDMHGNVMEYMLDLLYTGLPGSRVTLRGAVNTYDSDGNGRHVLHGGCFNRDAYQATSSYLNSEWPANGYSVIGLRVVVNLP